MGLLKNPKSTYSQVTKENADNKSMVVMTAFSKKKKILLTQTVRKRRFKIHWEQGPRKFFLEGEPPLITGAGLPH